jgi:HSP20 family protein
MKEERIMKEKKEAREHSTELTTTAAKPDTTPTPYGLMRRFATDMERLFEDFEGFRLPSLFGREFFPFTKEFENVDWSPEIEVRHNNGQFIVRTDLPGLKKEDVNVELTDNLLTIAGQRNDEKEEKREGYYRSERSYGSFYRQVPLPEGAKTDTATAEFTDGVLQITMQAPEREPKARRLEIKKGEEPAKAKAATK